MDDNSTGKMLTVDELRQYYEILGLQPGASREEIINAYKEQLKLCGAPLRLKQIEEAYQKLINLETSGGESAISESQFQEKDGWRFIGSDEDATYHIDTKGVRYDSDSFRLLVSITPLKGSQTFLMTQELLKEQGKENEGLESIRQVWQISPSKNTITFNHLSAYGKGDKLISRIAFEEPIVRPIDQGSIEEKIFKAVLPFWKQRSSSKSYPSYQRTPTETSKVRGMVNPSSSVDYSKHQSYSTVDKSTRTNFVADEAASRGRESKFMVFVPYVLIAVYIIIGAPLYYHLNGNKFGTAPISAYAWFTGFSIVPVWFALFYNSLQRRGKKKVILISAIGTGLCIVFSWIGFIIPDIESNSLQANSYKNSEYAFSIKFPDGWSIRNGQTAHTIVASENSKGESIVIQVWEMPQDMTYDTLSDNDLYALAKGMGDDIRAKEPDVLIENTGITSIANTKAIWTLCTFSFSTTKDKVIFYRFLKNRRMYQILCGSTPERFKTFESVFLSSARTFTFEDN